MVENQHQKITGYRDLTETEIAKMIEIKKLAYQVSHLITDLQGEPETDQRWIAIGKTDLQTGFMALTRAVARPTTF